MNVPCIDCGVMVDPYKLGAFREVLGWTEVRSAGGANHIAARVETGNVCCKGCGETRKLQSRRARAGIGALRFPGMSEE